MIAALWQLGRPRLVTHLYGMVLGGYGWGHWNRALTFRGVDELMWVLAAWFALHFGTMWLNAAVDRDEGEVFFGEAVEVPEGTTAAGFAALALSVALGAMANPIAAGCTGACAALAVAYSHPSTLWKGHPVLGPLVNLVGYGILTPTVGWSCVGVGLDARTLAMVGLCGLAVLGAYFGAQAFQEEEDRERGYRTLVVTHGPRAAVDAAATCMGLAWVGLVALTLAGWLPRMLLFVAPGWWWVHRWFLDWRQEAGGGSESHARELARRVGWLALVAFFLVFVQYAWESLQGGPVAGYGTAAGHPMTDLFAASTSDPS